MVIIVIIKMADNKCNVCNTEMYDVISYQLRFPDNCF